MTEYKDVFGINWSGEGDRRKLIFEFNFNSIVPSTPRDITAPALFIHFLYLTQMDNPVLVFERIRGSIRCPRCHYHKKGSLTDRG